MQALQLTLDLFNQNPVIQPKAVIIPALMVGQTLANQYLDKGKSITSKILSQLMSEEFGGSDAQGKWIWKDAYDALELAIAFYLKNHGQKFLQMDAHNALQQLLELEDFQLSFS